MKEQGPHRAGHAGGGIADEPSGIGPATLRMLEPAHARTADQRSADEIVEREDPAGRAFC